MVIKQKRIVFDIDGTIAIEMGSYKPQERILPYRQDYGSDFIERHTINAIVPHLIYPGYYALLRWLHQQGWSIDFFSSGVEERNRELIDELMLRSFGVELSSISYRIFSRQHAIDTDELRLHGDADHYQSYWYGQRKKKLGGVVTPESEVPCTLLVDDDKSYMVTSEEKNMVSLFYSHQYPRKHEQSTDFFKPFQTMHNAYYLAGILEAITARAEQEELSLREAAYQIQITDFGTVLNKELYTYPSLESLSFYHKGLKILQALEPKLKFYLKEIL